MNKVAIIVLNWNGADDTLECLDSLQGQSYKDFTIAVVDNGSTDGSGDILGKYCKDHPKNTVMFHNARNLGFAGGVNTGIRWAMKSKYEYVALFNNDAVADKSWLKALVDAVQPKNIGICTGLLLHRDGKTIDSTGDWYSVWGLSFPRNRDDAADKAPESGYVFSASGGASLYKTELLRKIGLFDEDFFAYYEDTDISFRTQLAGYKIMYTPVAIAYHKRGATSDKMSGFATYQTFKNLPLLFTKNVPFGLLTKVGSRLWLAYTLMLFNAIVKGSGKSALKGVWSGLLLSYKKAGERKHIQKNKRVNTKYIRSMLWNDLPPEQTGLRKFRKVFTDKK